MTKDQHKANIELIIKQVNEDMKTAFPGISVGSGAAIELKQENIDGCLHEDVSLLRSGDICVAYDWDDEELSESQQRIFYCIMTNFHDYINRISITVADNDGSGNGLYYGLMAIRVK